MKKLLLVFALGAFASLQAFDLDAWQAKCAMLDQEAERLQIAYTNCVAQLQKPGEDIVIPIEQHPDGRTKVIISAKKAQFFLDTGFVWCEDVTVKELLPDGITVKAYIAADNCVIDRDTRSGWSQGHTLAQYEDYTVEGNGIYFSFEEEYVKITSKSSILARDVKFKGVKL